MNSLIFNDDLEGEEEEAKSPTTQFEVSPQKEPGFMKFAESHNIKGPVFEPPASEEEKHLESNRAPSSRRDLIQKDEGLEDY